MAKGPLEISGKTCSVCGVHSTRDAHVPMITVYPHVYISAPRGKKRIAPAAGKGVTICESCVGRMQIESVKSQSVRRFHVAIENSIRDVYYKLMDAS